MLGVQPTRVQPMLGVQLMLAQHRLISCYCLHRGLTSGDVPSHQTWGDMQPDAAVSIEPPTPETSEDEQEITIRERSPPPTLDLGDRFLAPGERRGVNFPVKPRNGAYSSDLSSRLTSPTPRSRGASTALSDTDFASSAGGLLSHRSPDVDYIASAYAGRKCLMHSPAPLETGRTFEVGVVDEGLPSARRKYARRQPILPVPQWRRQAARAVHPADWSSHWQGVNLWFRSVE